MVRRSLWDSRAQQEFYATSVDPNNKTWSRAESDYLVTQCDDGSLCCGSRGSPEFGECCRENRGVWLDNLKVVSTKPDTGSTSSMASDQPAPSATVPPKPANASSSRTAIIVGVVAGVLGGIAGITGCALLIWLLRRHKKRRISKVAEMENTPVAQHEKFPLREAQPWEQDRKPPGELSGAVEVAELGASPNR